MMRFGIIIILVSTSMSINLCQPGQTQQNNSCLPLSCSDYLKRVYPSQQQNVDFYNDTKGSIETFSDHVTINFLFKDQLRAGTFRRDNDNSCITSELMRTNNVQAALGFNESTVTSTYDYNTGYRNWSFNLNQSQWLLLQGSSISAADHYIGQYAFRFNVSDTVLYTYYFSFSFAVNKAGEPWGKSQYIQQDVQRLVAPCDPGDSTMLKMKIKFAKTYSMSACADASLTPHLFYNQQLFVCVEIVDPMLKSCQIRAPHLDLTGSGLYHEMHTTTSMILSPGVWIYQVTVPFVFTSVQILFKGTAAGMYSTEQGIPVFGYSEELVCILMSENDTACPSQEQIKIYGPKTHNASSIVNVALFMKLASSFISMIIITFI